MPILEKLKEPTLWLIGAVCLYKGISSIVNYGAWGVIYAAVYGVVGGIAISGPLCEKIGGRFGALLYPLAFLKAPSKRVAAAESMLAKRDFEGAKAAFEAILKDEPENISVGVRLAHLLAKQYGEDGRFKACALLIKQLERRTTALSGESTAVLLLCDLLEESKLHEEAVSKLRAELAKNYCAAEESLLWKRLASLEDGAKAVKA